MVHSPKTFDARFNARKTSRDGMSFWLRSRSFSNARSTIRTPRSTCTANVSSATLRTPAHSRHSNACSSSAAATRTADRSPRATGRAGDVESRSSSDFAEELPTSYETKLDNIEHAITGYRDAVTRFGSDPRLDRGADTPVPADRALARAPRHHRDACRWCREHDERIASLLRRRRAHARRERAIRSAPSRSTRSILAQSARARAHAQRPSKR